ncbi:hypothetical protein BV898_04519 [Hypsibius exemplaris]|uniref:Glycosyltransferase family 92 protein n=1 Tax=Hypsibius exemplaris TaxID=2072580 RepID=A0A1W0X2D7_HYPEX|nr:hypothetical protein BV898_04519 [Hypsibius exemplaris]
MPLPAIFALQRQWSILLPSLRTGLIYLTLCGTSLILLSSPVLRSLIPRPISRYLTLGQTSQPIDWYATRFLDERLPVRPKPQLRKWNILACAMVHNEAAYLAEWLEHHRLQGVQHFVLYDYRSTDLLVYYPMFYEDLGVTDLISIIPAKFVPRELRDEKNREADRRLNKHYAMIDCYMRHRNLTEWIVMMEVSQFLYSSNHNSTGMFVKELQKRAVGEGRDLAVIATAAVTYGPAPNVSTVFDSWITPNANTGGVDFYYEPVAGSFDTFPLLTESNPFRAQHEDLGLNFQPCVEAEGCRQSNAPVVIVRATRCQVNNVTDCIFNAPYKKPISVPEGTLTPNARDLMVKNYPWRPRNLSPPHDSLPVDLPDLAKVPSWFSAVLDENAQRQADILRKRIMKMKPRVFRSVGRECVPEAVKTGQQVLCPVTHPYPFGEVGVKFLRECCRTDRDRQGLQLRVNSTSCWDGQKVPCVDPSHMAPWIHRSCCVNTEGIRAPVADS